METLNHRDTVDRLHAIGRKLAGIPQPLEHEESNWSQVNVKTLRALHRVVSDMDSEKTHLSASMVLCNREERTAKHIRGKRRHG